MKWMVFDVGGTEIKYSVMDETLARYGSGSVPTPMTCQKDFFEEICRIFEPHREETEGIAMSLPGFIDSERGVCLGGGALRYNHGKAVAAPLEEMTGLDFNPELPGFIQRPLESELPSRLWPVRVRDIFRLVSLWFGMS